MTPDERRKVKEIFAAAVDLSGAEQDRYIESACGDDELVRAKVRALIAVHKAAQPGPAEVQTASTALSRPFPSDKRFEIVRFLGSGGFGDVYEAFDTVRNARVALKMLRRAGPELLIGFKDEFRSFVDVSHPNLVKLYELFWREDLCYFTMEFIPGVNFSQFVREGMARGNAAQHLVDALIQLAEAVVFLHSKDLLHRDIKPSNIVVTSEGRVVLLDFGLARRLTRDALPFTIGGTIGFMAPEQMTTRRSDEAVDWYSVGALIHHALTGRIPSPLFVAHESPMKSITAAKSDDDSPPTVTEAGPVDDTVRYVRDDAEILHYFIADEQSRAIAEDLMSLAKKLLAADPAARPKGHDVLRYLRKRRAPADRVDGAPVVPRELQHDFVGRDAHLARLTSLYESIVGGGTAVANVFGVSGMGKSTLLQVFSRSLTSRRPEPLVLFGRSHHAEVVPYKTLDGIVDQIGKHLARMPSAEATAMRPAEFHFLTRLFPVLNQFADTAGPAHGAADVADPREVRKRAFACLVEVLIRLGEKRPVVMCIDDLQWGDLDSLDFFTELFGAHVRPRLLLIVAYRTEDAEISPFIAAYRAQLESSGRGCVSVDMEVGELSPAEAANLLQHSLHSADPRLRSLAERVGRSPFLLDRLVQYVRTDGGRVGDSRRMTDEPFSVEDAFRSRLRALPAEAQSLLAVIAVAGHPVSEGVAAVAAASGGATLLAVSTLVSEHLLRTREQPDRRELEMYHDKIREIVLADLPDAARRDLHYRVATAFEDLEPGDPALLAVHFQRAGMRDRALRYSIAAAEASVRALAFDRAVQFYRLALEVAEPERSQTGRLHVSIAEALVHAGRPAEAASSYEAAAEYAELEIDRVQLQIAAAGQLLRGGHIDRGIELLKSLARSLGIRLPRTKTNAVALLLFWRVQIALRRLKASELRAVSAAEAARMDLYWSLSTGFSLVDIVMGAVFHSKHLLLSLRSGDPRHTALSLALEAGRLAADGDHKFPSAERLLHRCRETALRLNDAHVEGFTVMSAAMCNLFTGRWQAARTHAANAEQIFRERCTGVAAWELANARMLFLGSLIWLGEWKEHRRKAAEFVQDAERRGDLFGVTQIRLGSFETLGYLIDDRPDEAERHLEEAMRHWSRGTADVNYFWFLLYRAQLLIYRSEPGAAWKQIEDAWNAFDTPFSLLRRVQYMRLLALSFRGGTAVGAAASVTRDRAEQYLEVAERVARMIDRERVSWAAGFATFIRSGVHAHRGELEAAIRCAKEAEAAFQVGDMPSHTAAVRWRLGELVGGTEGQQLQSRARAWMQSQGIVNPERMIQLMACGHFAPNQGEASINKD